MTVNKVRQVGYKQLADKLVENKDRFEQYLRQNNWVLSDMTSHNWGKNKYGSHVFGKITNNDLISTKGVWISPHDGGISISQFSQFGHKVGPRIYCNADNFIAIQE